MLIVPLTGPAIGPALAAGLCAATGLIAIPRTRRAARGRHGRLGVAGRGAATTRHAWLTGLLGVSGLAVVVVVLGGRFSLLLTGAAALLCLLTGRVRSRRQRAAVELSVVELCRGIAAELRAGHVAGRAFVSAGAALPTPSRSQLASAFAAAGQGAEGDLAGLLLVAARSPGLAGLSRLAACWRVAASTGAGLGPALDRVADGLQDELDVRRDIATTLAGPRATILLLAALPAAGLVFGTVVGADPIGFLVGTSIGRACLATAGALELAGLGWARRIVARASVPRLT